MASDPSVDNTFVLSALILRPYDCAMQAISQRMHVASALSFTNMTLSSANIKSVRKWSLSHWTPCLFWNAFLIMASITMLKRRGEATSDISVSGGSIGGGFSEGPWGGT